MTPAVGPSSSFLLRPGAVGDVAFIRDSWKRGYVDGGRAPNCERVLLWEGTADLITALLKRSSVFVAVSPEDDTQLLGWVCFERRGRVVILHFVHVKHVFRKRGLCRALLSAAIDGAPGLMHSLRTKDGDRLAMRLRSTWNPFLLGGIA